VRGIFTNSRKKPLRSWLYYASRRRKKTSPDLQLKQEVL